MRAIKDLDYRDAKYDHRAKKLMSTVVYNEKDLEVAVPRRRNMHDRLKRGKRAQWITVPDLGSLWYARWIHRDEKRTAWKLSIDHRPYDKRRSGLLSGLSYSRRPKIEVLSFLTF